MSATLAEPLFFGPEARPLFGWLHRAAAPGGLGLVVCNPFGYEAVCAHRSLRRFAASAAAAGVAALRFDYDGTGDSAGDDGDPDRLGAWVASVGSAVAALRRHTGVERVCLLGVRLGALIAALAAAARDDVAGLIAIAPVVSGKAYLRELRVLQAALALSPPPPGGVVDAGVQEALGFVITAETRDAIGKVDLLRQAAPPAPAVLILDRDDLPSADRYAESLGALGAAVDLRRLPGYVDMVLDPHKALVPEEMVRAATAWLGERAGGGGAGHPIPAADPERPCLVTARVIERPVFVDAERCLFGVLSAPATAPRTGRGILLLNAGSVHHIGPNRLYTVLARRWAGRGHVVLRFDIAGIGDSLTRPGAADNVVYSARAVEDVAAAVAFLRQQEGVVDCRALGLCSGAYHAFKSAVAGHALDGVIVINPLTFFWKEGQSLDYPPHRVASEAVRYTRSAMSLESWKKLLRGKVHVRAVAQTMARHGTSLVVNRARDLSRRLGRPWRDDLGAELDQVARRQIDLRFVFATGDPGLALLLTQGGSVVKRLGARGRLVIAMIDGPDHTFTPVWSHAALTASLAAMLDSTQRSGAPSADREARGAAVIDREAPSAAVIDREAPSAAVIDREAPSAAVIDSAQSIDDPPGPRR